MRHASSSGARSALGSADDSATPPQQPAWPAAPARRAERSEVDVTPTRRRHRVSRPAVWSGVAAVAVAGGLGAAAVARAGGDPTEVALAGRSVQSEAPALSSPAASVAAGSTATPAVTPRIRVQARGEVDRVRLVIRTTQLPVTARIVMAQAGHQALVRDLTLTEAETTVTVRRPAGLTRWRVSVDGAEDRSGTVVVRAAAQPQVSGPTAPVVPPPIPPPDPPPGSEPPPASTPSGPPPANSGSGEGPRSWHGSGHSSAGGGTNGGSAGHGSGHGSDHGADQAPPGPAEGPVGSNDSPAGPLPAGRIHHERERHIISGGRG
ncbi:MAG TPA: hypothetical protein DEQ43_22395 [Nocardioides bacterium]|nr:hypothetical protein [Nocardioides sp.]